MKRKLPNASEMGKLGGRKVFEQRGSQYMSELASRGRKEVLTKDPDYYKKLSAAGVEARRKKSKEAKSPTSRLTKLLTGR